MRWIRTPYPVQRLGDESGSAAVEFAIVGPLFILLLLGIMSWGGYFWTAHAVQQVANDAARAAVAGMDEAERTSLASAAMSSEIGDYAYLTASAASLSVQSSGEAIKVSISYDASGTPFWSLSQMVPMPSSTIVRSSAVRLGGY